MTAKNDQSSISISFNSGRQSWVKVNGTPLPITNTNIDLPILTEAPVTSVNGQTGDVVVSGGGGANDITINITAQYDDSKEEWNTDSCVVTFGNNNDYDSIISMLQDTDNLPKIGGGIKITGDYNGFPLAVTMLPTQMFAMDIGSGDNIMFFITHPGIGNILCTLAIEDEEIVAGFTIMS